MLSKTKNKVKAGFKVRQSQKNNNFKRFCLANQGKMVGQTGTFKNILE